MRCAWCEELFDAPLAEIKRGDARYCSISCGAKGANSRRSPGVGTTAMSRHAREAARVQGVLSDSACCNNCRRRVGQTIDVHHRDRNTQNNSPSNLILLCRSCHVTLHNRQRRGPDRSFVCRQCGRDFVVSNGDFTSGHRRGIYCSQSCSAKAHNPQSSPASTKEREVRDE
ncbi:HNH endonuclease [Patescibacteria group bacterium]|nr:HNH endonuclease [Patescibacteria group bacterium]